MLAMWMFFWPPNWPGPTPPTGDNGIGSKYKYGFKMPYILR